MTRPPRHNAALPLALAARALLSAPVRALSALSPALLIALSPALSAPAAASPGVEFLSARVAVVRAQLAKPTPTPEEKARIDAELMAVLRPIMNFQHMSAAVMGKRWPTLTSEQQARFLGLFEDLVFHSYTRRIRSVNDDYTVEYGEERALEGVLGGVEVDAVAKTPKAEVELRFALLPVQAGFEVVDVVIDEVSLVENYREEFAKVVVKEGLDGLFSRMESQLIKEGGRPRVGGGAEVKPEVEKGDKKVGKKVGKKGGKKADKKAGQGAE